MGRALTIILLAIAASPCSAQEAKKDDDGWNWLRNLATSGGAQPPVEQRQKGQKVNRGMRQVELNKARSIRESDGNGPLEKLAARWFKQGPQANPPKALPQQAGPQQALPLQTVPKQAFGAAFPFRGSMAQSFQRPTALRGPILDAEMKDPHSNSDFFVVGFVAFFAGAGIALAVSGPLSRARSYF